MSRFRDIRRAARRDLHEHLQVPAYFLRNASPLLAVIANVRLWVKWDEIGQVKGSRIYPAEQQNETDKIRFDLTQVPRIENGAIVSIDVGEAYRVNNTLAIDDQFQTAEVVRMTPNDLARFTLPVPGANGRAMFDFGDPCAAAYAAPLAA